MKLFYITLSLVILLVSCNGNQPVTNGPDWNFYLKKSQGTTIKILCTIQEPSEFNYLKKSLKPLLRDSFHINALIYYISKDKIVKTLLDDSKRINKVVYDIVIADPDIIQSLFSLGLLYGKYLNTLPNNKDLDYAFINSLNPFPVLRDYVVPYSCNQFVMLYDSCDIPHGPTLQNVDLSKLAVLNNDYTFNNLYYIYNTVVSPDQADNSSIQVNDSLLLIIRQIPKPRKSLNKLYYNNSINGVIFNKTEAINMLSDPKIKDAKVQELNNSFPVYYKMAAITTTSSNIITAMVVLNQLIDRDFQVKKYINTNEQDLPVLNLAKGINTTEVDSTYSKYKLNTLTRSKVIFSISDVNNTKEWWKSINL